MVKRGGKFRWNIACLELEGGRHHSCLYKHTLQPWLGLHFESISICDSCPFVIGHFIRLLKMLYRHARDYAMSSIYNLSVCQALRHQCVLDSRAPKLSVESIYAFDCNVNRMAPNGSSAETPTGEPSNKVRPQKRLSLPQALC